MRSDNSHSPYLSGIVRDTLHPFRYRSGVMRLLGIPEPGSAFVGSCLRVSPSMTYSALQNGSRMHSYPELYHREARKDGKAFSDDATGRAVPHLRTDEEQTGRLQQEGAGHGASGDHEQLLPKGGGNSSQPAATDTENGLRTEEHCIDPKGEHERPCTNLHSLPPGLEPVRRGSPAGPYYPGTGDLHHADRHPGTSGRSGIPEAEGAAGRTAPPSLFNGNKDVDLSILPKAQGHSVPDLTSIVPPAAGEIRPLSVDDRDDGPLAGGKARDIPHQEFPEGRRLHVLRSSKQSDRGISEGLGHEDFYNCADGRKHRDAGEGRSSNAHLTASRKDRPFPEGGGHAPRRTHAARTEEQPGNQAPAAVQPQQVVIVRQQAAKVQETAAFWERSYLSRLRLRSVR